MQSDRISGSDEPESSIELIPQQDSVASSGYKSAGRSLHGLLQDHAHSRIPSWLQGGLNFLFNVAALVLVVVGGIMFLLATNPIADLSLATIYQWDPRLVLGIGGLFLLICFTGIARHGIDRWETAKQEEAAAGLWCLVGDENEPTIRVSGPDQQALKSTYERVDPPCRVQETEQSPRELVDQLPATPAEKSFHIADFSITERKETDVHIVDKSVTLGDGGAVQLPLDTLSAELSETPVTVLIQFVIVQGDTKEDNDDRQESIRNGRDRGLTRMVATAPVDVLMDLVPDADTSETGSQDPDALTGDASRRYHGLERTNGTKAFSLNARAIAIGDPEEATEAFEIIRRAITETLTEFVSVEYTSYAAPAAQDTSRLRPWKRKHRVWERFLEQRPQQRGKLSLRPRRTPAFFADPETIWNYLLISTETGVGSRWDHGSGPRDTQDTDKPASDEYSEYQWDSSFAEMGDESSTDEQEEEEEQDEEEEEEREEEQDEEEEEEQEEEQEEEEE